MQHSSSSAPTGHICSRSFAINAFTICMGIMLRHITTTIKLRVLGTLTGPHCLTLPRQADPLPCCSLAGLCHSD